MNRFLLIFFCLLFSLLTSAQTKLITGKVVIDGEEELSSFEGINILNSTTNGKTITNSDGIFSIKASLNDELTFKDGGVEERKLKIIESVLKKGFIVVHLNAEVIELKETVVNTLDKNWQKNIKHGKTESTKMYEGLGLDPNLQYYKVNPNMTSTINNNGIFQDPALWIAMITGKRKKDIKVDNYFKKTNKIQSIRDFYTDAYFIDDLKIPKEKIPEFLNFCYNSTNLEQFLKENKYDEIVVTLEGQAPIYLQKLQN